MDPRRDLLHLHSRLTTSNRFAQKAPSLSPFSHISPRLLASALNGSFVYSTHHLPGPFSLALPRLATRSINSKVGRAMAGGWLDI